MSVRCGRDYYDAGAVISVTRRGSDLTALVEGSGHEPYRVQIAMNGSDLVAARCTCLYEGGWCKHIVAALFTCLHNPDSVEERPSLTAMLEGMSREELVDLLKRLTADDPILLERLEHDYRRQKKTNGSLPKINGKQIRKYIQSLIHSLDHMRASEAYRHVNEVVEEVRAEVARARAYVELDDEHNALIYLEAIAEAYLEEWTYLDGSDGQTGDPFEDLGSAFIEALLTVELTREERRTWAARLQRWQDELYNYGIEAPFEAAIAAAEVGWDDPALRDILAADGPIRVRPWPAEESTYGDDLIATRLRILDRRGRHEEYLRLAGAEGHLSSYLTMLVRIGLIDEAVSQGIELMSETDQAFDLAKALLEKGAPEEALRIAEHGFTLGGRDMSPVATWVCELANDRGETERALRAALIAFRDRPNLRMYTRLRELSGPAWPHRRERLLDQLRKNTAHPADCLEIFLDEKLQEDAIAIADRYSHSFDLVRVVVEAVQEAHPAWVVRAAKRQAEPIIENAQSSLYHHAVDWLTYARDAYERMNAREEWRTYVDALEEKHARKRKLMAMMRERFSRPRPARLTRH